MKCLSKKFSYMLTKTLPEAKFRQKREKRRPAKLAGVRRDRLWAGRIMCSEAKQKTPGTGTAIC